MSWDDYVKKLKEADRNGPSVIQHATIWGRLQGHIAPWTVVDPDFPVTAKEVEILSGDRTGFRGAGPSVAGKKCMVLTDQMDDPYSFCLNMKTKQDAEKNSYTIVVGKTNQTFIIAMGVKNAHAGTVTTKVYDTVKYLRDLNF